MPYITATLAAINAIGGGKPADAVEKKAQDLSGGTAAREQRDIQSEIKGAQGTALDQAKQRQTAEAAMAQNRALGNALNQRARAGASAFGGTILTGPLGSQAPAQTTGKTLLGS